MNLRDLHYLVALAEHKHFSHAANACFVSQPTLSTQIKKLEDELGVALVERSSRSVLLTEIGREIADRARVILRDAEQIRELARRTHDPESGTIRLGLFPTLGPYLLPHVVPRISERFPRLELLLTEEKTEAILRLLREGRIDAALLALPIHDDQLHCEPLFEEAFLLAVPKNHPYAARQTLAAADLKEQTLLLLEDGHCLRDQALDVCRYAGASERSGFRATSLETLRQMVAAGVGMTLLPALSVRAPAERPAALSLLRFKGTPPSRRIAIVWRKRSALAEFLAKLAPLLIPPRALLTGQAERVVKSAARGRKRP